MTAALKTQNKTQVWSSLVLHCRHSSFYPSGAPPWDSRPGSGAGVAHHHQLHRPRSIPTALGPAPHVTFNFSGKDSKRCLWYMKPHKHCENRTVIAVLQSTGESWHSALYKNNTLYKESFRVSVRRTEGRSIVSSFLIRSTQTCSVKERGKKFIHVCNAEGFITVSAIWTT